MPPRPVRNTLVAAEPDWRSVRHSRCRRGFGTGFGRIPGDGPNVLPAWLVAFCLICSEGDNAGLPQTVASAAVDFIPQAMEATERLRRLVETTEAGAVGRCRET